jgi:hypothetical protein
MQVYPALARKVWCERRLSFHSTIKTTSYGSPSSAFLSRGLSYKTAYISHQKSLALGGVHSSRAKTIPPDRLNWAKRPLGRDRIVCFYKRIFLGKKIGLYLRQLLRTQIGKTREALTQARGSVHEKDERSTLLWSHICFAGGIRSLFKRSDQKFPCFFICLSCQFALERGVNRAMNGWMVFIDHLFSVRIIFFCTLYEMRTFIAWI